MSLICIVPKSITSSIVVPVEKILAPKRASLVVANMKLYSIWDVFVSRLPVEVLMMII